MPFMHACMHVYLLGLIFNVKFRQGYKETVIINGVGEGEDVWRGMKKFGLLIRGLAKSS
jgi:hypothetical protein